MKRKQIKQLSLVLIVQLLIWSSCSLKDSNQRQVLHLKKGWKFIKGDQAGAESYAFDDAQWEQVDVPHDWAIYGPFDKNNDAYETIVTQDGEKVPKLRTGRTGGLPHMGVGWYRKNFHVPSEAKGKKLFVEFDGAMSHSKVYLNGTFIGEWPYGYTSFHFDLTDHVKTGEENVLAVRLENKPKMSRWYPGAGIYRNVRLVYKPQTHIAHWGTYITTPDIKQGEGTVNIKTKVNGNGHYKLLTEIYSPQGELLKSGATVFSVQGDVEVEQTIQVDEPELWDVETPRLYKVLSKVIHNNQVIDVYESGFGFRHFTFTSDDGFHLNGRRVPLQGVCMHHDLGPIGAAVNHSAIRRQLRLLKEMGCNAIRTAHNPPSPDYLAMCDSMGFLVIDEAFDQWKIIKVVNGYNNLWDDWREKDLKALLHRDKNHPSIIMWSVGNEISEQYGKESWKIAKSLVDICHEVDSTRPVTIGLNTYKPVKNNFANQFDVKGWNYYLDYTKLHKERPNWAVYASESQSTVSSRGFYDTDARPKRHYRRDNLQCSSYALEFPGWANTPDVGFAVLDDNPYLAGEFVWTGFDYLGEPSPYNIEWPTRSSYFGLIDLCGIPKDIYYMYQQRWTDKEVLHVLPHWNWEEGQNVPVHVFTNYDSAELFVNGKSYGVQSKDSSEIYRRYRLVWNDVIFEPGTIEVVGLDKNGQAAKATIVETAGEPYAINLIADKAPVKANGEDLAFVEVQIVDKEGRICPWANNEVHFKVEGNGKFRAAGNGDATDLEPFHSVKRKCFYGKCVAMVQTSELAGEIILSVSSGNLKSGEVILKSH
ncbi:glycoside hydrolase family 2 TIM barrel-domain containing protein [Carboxylicivirga sp. M1479]|uniref:glycoside hydrolase family 2 TIM barrel-domain containing protein n=1 Tax=Carboxylicivirga sp. M1479 TaxID=2594476 RepID=UPI001177D1A8|nr:glycoside hydrolase family 2 TIM barrel-domain containing protein [Carboxylicivirga sp. M1479]TRX60956.1 glycoside hydrolase family 2 protein [Carboxylicivirga sp. M1479]